MKEEDFLSTIKSIAGNDYIGDDCAYIKDLGIVVSQDSLVEDVHFSMEYITPYQLGYKSGKVNLSDIIASGGICKYMSVALSLPKTTTTDFIKEFYNGLLDGLEGVEIIGGDITGSDKIMISVTVIGTDKGRRISSRKNAGEGYVVVTNGKHGSSAGGLKLLQSGKMTPKELINSHIMPDIDSTMAEIISENIDVDYAMMDTSDGLADALFKIAKASNVSIVLDFNKVDYSADLKKIFPAEYQKMILFGGEDYKTIAVIPHEFAQKYNLNIIGKVIKKTETPLIVKKYGEKDLYIANLNNCFNHFN